MARASYHKMGREEAARLCEVATEAMFSGSFTTLVAALGEIRRTLWREYQMGDAADVAEGKGAAE